MVFVKARGSGELSQLTAKQLPRGEWWEEHHKDRSIV